MTMLTRATRVARASDVVANDLSDTESVMLDIDQGRYFGVKNAANAIWALTAEPVSIGEICDRLTAQFEVDADTCEREVQAFFSQLVDYGLVDVVDHHPAAG